MGSKPEENGYNHTETEALLDYLKSDLWAVKAQNQVLEGQKNGAYTVAIALIVVLFLCNFIWGSVTFLINLEHSKQVQMLLSMEMTETVTTTKTERVIQDVIETITQEAEGENAINILNNKNSNSTINTTVAK